jgi:hypothetical protein
MAYDFGDPGPGLRETQTCGGVKLVNGIPTLTSSWRHYLYEQTIQTWTCIRFLSK